MYHIPMTSLYHSSVMSMMLSTLLVSLFLVSGTSSQDTRDVIVHLFEWKWSDVASECPSLAARGYGGVQVSPPQEHRIITDPPYPWWQRYQPVSYTATSRSGDEAAFQSMVESCSTVGVSIYPEAVINHMTTGGSGVGSDGSFFDAGDEFGQDYPGVPYTEMHFNGRDRCFTESMDIESYTNASEIRNCRLGGLRDLRLDEEYVRGELSAYLNKLISWGVAGFRVDAAKHMWTADLEALFATLDGPPTIYQEVIQSPNEPIFASDYIHMGYVTEFGYGRELSAIIKKTNGAKLADLVDFGEAWGFLPSASALVFVDNHDNQRGHGAGGDILTHETPREYQLAVGFMLTWDYGWPRVMSSYTIYDTDHGPPYTGEGATNDVDCSDLTAWQCEHRWTTISNLVTFHNVVRGEPVTNWYDNGANVIAFSRGSKGFAVFSNEDVDVDVTLQTGLAEGEYCNVALCDSPSPPCVGASGCGAVAVAADGSATVNVPWGNPIVALHV